MTTGQFAKSAAMLGNAEEHTALSRALSQLAETEEKVEQLHKEQADEDYYVISELLKDYINMIQSVKVSKRRFILHISPFAICIYILQQTVMLNNMWQE